MPDNDSIVNEEYSAKTLPDVIEESKEAHDITIKVEGKSFPAHRTILIASCSYFRNVLQGEEDTVYIDEISSKGIDLILKYLYSGKIVINSDNIYDLLNASNSLYLAWVEEQCCKYLKNYMNRENYLKIWKMIRSSSNKAKILVKTAILKNIEPLMITSDFWELTFDEMKEIVRSDDNLTREEPPMYNAVMGWVKHDLINRKPHLLELLNLLKIQDISEQFFTASIFIESILREDIILSNWMVDNFILTQYSENLVKSVNGKLFTCFERPWSWLCTCYSYDLDKTELKKLTSKPELGEFYPVLYKGSIFFTCGKIDDSFNKKLHKYDLQNNNWSDIDFDCELNSHSACVLNDKMYLIGGSGEDLVREFDIASLKQSSESSMNYTRILPGVSVHGQAIYVCGSRLESEEIKSVERFDPREGEWKLLPDMTMCKEWCTSAVVNDDMYCAEVTGKFIEKFDIRQNAWERLEDLPGSDNNSLVAAGDHLYSLCTGGIAHYKRNRNKWSVNFVDLLEFIFPIYTSNIM